MFQESGTCIYKTVRHRHCSSKLHEQHRTNSQFRAVHVRTKYQCTSFLGLDTVDGDAPAKYDKPRIEAPALTKPASVVAKSLPNLGVLHWQKYPRRRSSRCIGNTSRQSTLLLLEVSKGLDGNLIQSQGNECLRQNEVIAQEYPDSSAHHEDARRNLPTCYTSDGSA